MIKLNREEFLQFKSSDTIIVYGSGWSINSLPNNIKYSSNFDSIGFNWFLKSKIPTTFYIIREQCVPDFRNIKNESLPDLYDLINSNHYNNSCSIVHKACYLSNDNGYTHSKNLSKITGKGIIVNDVKQKRGVDTVSVSVKKFSTDIFEEGVQHGLLTFYNVLHIITYLKYKRIIFAGIDLYDSRYFWLKEDETRVTVKNKNKTYESRHATCKKILELIKVYNKCYPGIKMYTYNNLSLLKKVMDVWSY